VQKALTMCKREREICVPSARLDVNEAEQGDLKGGV